MDKSNQNLFRHGWRICPANRRNCPELFVMATETRKARYV